MSTELVEQVAKRIRALLPEVATYEEEAADRVEGTGSSVIEVRDAGPWAGPANGARHRVIQINVLSDRSRDASGHPISDDADRNAWTLWETVDDGLNDPDNSWRHEWSGVHTSRRAEGPTLTNIPNGDGGVMLSARYEVSHD